MTGRILSIAIIVLFGILNSGCGVSSSDEQMAEKTSRMPNPASQKCVGDGFQLEPLYQHGVPVGAMCVNPATGIKCEEWSYFRGECMLN